MKSRGDLELMESSVANCYFNKGAQDSQSDMTHNYERGIIKLVSRLE